MKRLIIGIFCGLILISNLALAQVPHPERYQIIYGNRDGTPMSVQLGDTIEFPIWGRTDPTDSIDSIGVMFNPMKSVDNIIPERLGGICAQFYEPGGPCRDEICLFTNPVPNPYPNGTDSTSQAMLWIQVLAKGPCLPFWTGSDTIEIGHFIMSVTSDSSYLGQTICPFAEGRDPANGSLLWGFNDGLHQVIPVAIYGCLYFSTCNAVAGDANGDGIFNAIDIVYGVNYLKGHGNPLPTCDCPTIGPVYVGADANGDCVFNGLDITYCVNYLKGHGPAPRRCPDC